MNKRIVSLLALIIAVALSVSWFVHRQHLRALNSGDVYVRDQSSAPAPVKSPAPAATPSKSSAPTPQVAPQQLATPTLPVPLPAAPAAEAHAKTRVAVPSHGDTIPRNPPNGLVFAGSGKYQLYRQGDITWRLDTETGESCILFATDAQWSRTRVFQNGCASHRRAQTIAFRAN